MKKSLISFLETFIAGVFLSILIMIFVGQSLEITGDSMYPTLKDRERIVVEKVTYKSMPPKQGDIVVFRSLQNDQIFLIKRVVAAAGETIGSSTEDELGLLENYVNTPIPQGYIAVMGDNRTESYDSRIFGLVPLEKIVGRAFIAYWPLTSIRKINP